MSIVNADKEEAEEGPHIRGYRARLPVIQSSLDVVMKLPRSSILSAWHSQLPPPNPTNNWTNFLLHFGLNQTTNGTNRPALLIYHLDIDWLSWFNVEDYIWSQKFLLNAFSLRLWYYGSRSIKWICNLGTLRSGILIVLNFFIAVTRTFLLIRYIKWIWIRLPTWE